MHYSHTRWFIKRLLKAFVEIVTNRDDSIENFAIKRGRYIFMTYLFNILKKIIATQESSKSNKETIIQIHEATSI